MNKLLLLSLTLLMMSPFAKADLGINIGLGIPFVRQLGLNYTMGQKWTVSATYNTLSISSNDASVDLSMPELIVQWHPFSGSFYIGAGMGRETLDVKAKDSASGQEASAEVTANTAIIKLGWMWGKANGGFWFGMDISHISPSGGEVDIDGPLPSTSQEYQDVEDAGEAFGQTAYTNITFAKFGWLF